MLNKDIELLEGLVLVWGNDYLKTKKEESKTKYIDNFTKLINIYGQIYLEEINKLKDTNNDIVEEVCNYYSIETIDMYTLSGLYPFDDDLATYYFNQQSNSEGYYYVHPNSIGQKMMFDALVNKI